MSPASLALDYQLEVPSLQRLLRISRRNQWDLEDVPWDRSLADDAYGPILAWHGALRSEYLRAQSTAKKEALARQFVAYEFSQILHGEQGAMMLAAQLINSVEELDAKLFAAVQTKDEARHVEAVRNLVKRIGPLYPIGPLLKETLDTLLSCGIWPKQVLGLQLFLEGRALLSFREHSLFVQDPVFLEAVGNIERDEAQHVGFGVLHLRRGVDALSPTEKQALIDYGVWLDRHLWTLIRTEDYRMIFLECGLDYDEYLLTMRPPSKLRPDISLEQKKTSDRMYQTFERWFLQALVRVGLPEVATHAAEERRIAFDPGANAEPDEEMAQVLPWARPLAEP